MSCFKISTKINKFLIMAIRNTKRAFTLVELSVVLLVLSLLVASLLVGRQIVERTKVVKAVADFDYYYKSFTMFRDSYDVLPGNLDVKNCKKNAIFTDFKFKNDTICKDDYIIDDNAPIYGTYAEQLYYRNNINVSLSSLQLNASGIIASVQKQWGSIVTDVYSGREYAHPDPESFDSNDQLAASSSFDKGVKILFGSTGEGLRTGTKKVKGFEIRGMMDTTDFTAADISTDEQKMNIKSPTSTILNKNVVIMYRNVPGMAKNDNAGHRDDALGALSPKNSNKVDVKMDDGLPGSGKIIAIRNGRGNRYGGYSPDSDVVLSVCHNGTPSTLAPTNIYADNGGSYLNSDSVVDGCNLIYAMNN